MSKLRVSIVGASGLVGECLIKALLGHPRVELKLLVSEHAAGRAIGELLPALAGECELKTVSATPAEVAQASDVVFCAKKGAETFQWVPALLDGGAKVIDIGGEFRFRDAAVYETWYKEPHACKDLLKQTVWGLPELCREEIRAAKLVGNPGCYVTSAVLALAPFVAQGLVEDAGLIVDSYSGLSGAGRQFNAKLSNLFVDVDENLRAYGVGNHKHTPEIEQGLARAAGRDLKATFVPHLAPLDRGILTTAFARPKPGLTTEKALAALKDFHTPARAPFVRVRAAVGDVNVRDVAFTNYCDVSAQVVERSGQLVVASALDNLVKGAAGQALQNMNLMSGFEETLGLKGRSL
ncbi:MAG: N-acetyl-gamma-glutamyl-phosphate reductase [Planctomycetota bacterium]|nr:N-acetyl-gamma-glutamyl-phosphate reductase [Planctomycetota bacterium]